VISLVAGRIACASLLNEMYATGVTDIDNLLMKLTVSSHMTELERDTVIPIMLKVVKLLFSSIFVFLDRAGARHRHSHHAVLRIRIRSDPDVWDRIRFRIRALINDSV
jgi:hypothetical protein